MKFHPVHGANVMLDEGGTRATRISSFCDAITFGSKPLAINSRLSFVLSAKEEWSGALRLGVTIHDPASLTQAKLPRYSCPDLTSQEGFWARPLPEKWAANGTRLTFYVSSQGYLQLFINNEHKGAVLSGLPVKEQLWPILDLYGITVSAKYVACSGNAPVEVVARGPEAVRAYHHACKEGSIAFYRTRLAIVGPPGSGKTSLLKVLLNNSYDEDEIEPPQHVGIDTTTTCQSSYAENDGEMWSVVLSCGTPAAVEEADMESSPHQLRNINLSEEEYYQAIATNIVRELLLNKKRREEKRRTPSLVRSALLLQGLRTQSRCSVRAESEVPLSAAADRQKNHVDSSDDLLPDDLPERVVELVDAMLKEAENKQDWDKKETEKNVISRPRITFNIWDFDGHPKYFIIHQAFLSPQALYLLVFDLTENLDAPIYIEDGVKGPELTKADLTTLQLIHIWLSAIHVAVAHSNSCLNSDERQEEMDIGEDRDSLRSPCLQPMVIIVGTHKNSVHPDPETRNRMVEETFNRIKESIRSKPYHHHVMTEYFAIDCKDSEGMDKALAQLRHQVGELALQQEHVGLEVPLQWLAFENSLERLKNKDVNLATVHQLAEVARQDGIESNGSFRSLLHFFHHQGQILHVKSETLSENDEELDGAVVLNPQWLVDHVYKLCDPNQSGKKDDDLEQILVEDQERELRTYGLFTDASLDYLWPNIKEEKSPLIGILERMDVLLDILPPKAGYIPRDEEPKKLYFLPWLCDKTPEIHKNIDSTENALVLAVDFSGILPVGLFSRLLVRICHWTEDQNWMQHPKACKGYAMIGVDKEHDLIFKMTKIHYSRLQIIVRKKDGQGDPNGNSTPSLPVCAKVRHLVEGELEALREYWFKRLSFQMVVPCPCDRACDNHGTKWCGEEECLHFLPLHECLSKKVVQCDFRQVKTDFIQKYFPQASTDVPVNSEHSQWEENWSIMGPPESKPCWETDSAFNGDQSWMKTAGRFLNTGIAGKDWSALAKRLGYNAREISRFGDEANPGLLLLRDWVESNGRTRYCIDVLVACLRQMGRDDAAEVIHTQLEPEIPAPPVFISYQWDSQESVLNLRRRLELSGFPCWMDVGQMGGGDSLYGRIYEGISRAKVVLCCLTPRYAASSTCSREASLADVLRKPIIPLMLEPTPWPPPGPLAIVLSSLVYIDLCGIGGHGGNGRQADWDSRFREIVDRLSHFITPSFSPNHMVSSRLRDKVSLRSTETGAMKQEDFGNISYSLDTGEASILADQDNDGIPDEMLSDEAYPREGSATYEQQQMLNRVSGCSICCIL